jgi:hypothetical protein
MELILSIFGIFLLLIFCCIFIGAAVYAGCSLMTYLEERKYN